MITPPPQTPEPVGERALLFRLGENTYALRLTAVEGLGEAVPLHPVPRAPEQVLGLAEWRGHLLTVLDLPSLLGEPAAPADDPCLVRLAAPLDRSALWIPCGVRLGWVMADSDSPWAEPVHPVRSAPADSGQAAPRLIHATSLLRRIASAVVD